MLHAKQGQSGFTLLELLVAIAIIGLLASVVLASLSPARERARNAQVVSQMYEYQKALDLYYLNEGRYPNSWPNNPLPTSRDNIICVGEGFAGGYQCVPFADSNVRAAEVESVLVPNYISQIVHINQGTWSSAAYRGCSDFCSNLGCPATQCTAQDYSLFYMLEGESQDCGKGVVANDGSSYPGWTWCQISSAQN